MPDEVELFIVETGERPVSEVGEAVDDFKQRLNNIISTEGDSVRELAQKDTSRIVSQAREEYKRRLTSFLNKEIENILSQARKDSEEIMSAAIREKAILVQRAKEQAQEEIALIISS